MFEPRASSQMPIAMNEWNIVVSRAEPSTIDASITWPCPERPVSSSAAQMPRASSMPPPPKSPTMFSGGTGPSPLRPTMSSAPDRAM